MNFPNPLSGFDIEADLTSLTSLQTPSTRAPPRNLSNYNFPDPEESSPQLNGTSAQKVFFITNCGSLLGRTIAQVALDQGHYVAACAREKHLADLNVLVMEV